MRGRAGVALFFWCGRWTVLFSIASFVFWGCNLFQIFLVINDDYTLESVDILLGYCLLCCVKSKYLMMFASIDYCAPPGVDEKKENGAVLYIEPAYLGTINTQVTTN